MNCCLVGEEVQKKGQTLDDLTNYLADVICERSKRGKDYGVILVPEGLIEFIPEMGALIAEINDILAEEFEGDIEEFVLPKLKEEPRELFKKLPKAVST